ncbi:MAG: SDR family oxidoreductase [Sphingobacteriales bacterium]|nr:SDR family oxidoreductase [Sphingobacteriales bacterium]MCC7223065.1 SDR family oxidoreductase [Chitinophagales bacterium]
MTAIKNSIVLITGGANGIGKLLGKSLLEKGAKSLVIWDINEANLESTTAELSQKGYDVHPYLVDVADTDDIDFAAQDVIKELGGIDILVNNAGIIVGKAFHEHSTREIEKTIRINVLGVMHTTNAFLPNMIERSKGHVVNIASASSYTANPNMSVYAASKWAVMGWSESLRLELERLSQHLHVTTIAPSYINTGMFEGVSAPLLTPILDPETIVAKIVQAIERNKVLVLEPAIVKSLPVLKGVLPTRAFDFLAEKIFGVYHSMDNFKGRKPEEAIPDKKVLEKSKKL